MHQTETTPSNNYASLLTKLACIKEEAAAATRSEAVLYVPCGSDGGADAKAVAVAGGRQLQLRQEDVIWEIPLDLYKDGLVAGAVAPSIAIGDRRCSLPYVAASSAAESARICCLLERRAGRCVQEVGLSSLAKLPLLLGPGSKRLLACMLRWEVQVFVFSQQLAQCDAECRLAVSGRDEQAVRSACGQLERDALGEPAEAAFASRKLLPLLQHERAAVLAVLQRNGAVALAAAGCDALCVYGQDRALAAATVEELQRLAFSWHTAKLQLDLPQQLGEPALRQVAAESGAELLYAEGDGWLEVSGRQPQILAAFGRLGQTAVRACRYEIESTPEVKEFICGKKDGKINKIMKELPVSIDFEGAAGAGSLLIVLSGRSLGVVREALALLAGEFPAEECFYVAECHHKRIIGHGGKNIQGIMKKYGVYIKFLSFSECLALNAASGRSATLRLLPNVLVKTPSKNKSVLPAMRAEVLAATGERNLAVSYLCLPAVSPACFGHRPFAEAVKACCSVADVFWHGGCLHVFSATNAALPALPVPRAQVSAEPFEGASFLKELGCWHAFTAASKPSLVCCTLEVRSPPAAARKPAALAFDPFSLFADELPTLERLSVGGLLPALPQPPPGLIGSFRKADSLPPGEGGSKHFPGAGAQSLAGFLAQLELSKYLQLFQANEIDLSALATLTDEDLRVIGVSAFGARKKILSAAPALGTAGSSYAQGAWNAFNGDWLSEDLYRMLPPSNYPILSF